MSRPCHRLFNSITSSVRTKSDCGIVSPRALAVFHVDDQFELGRLLDGQIGRAGALQGADRVRQSHTTLYRLQCIEGLTQALSIHLGPLAGTHDSSVEGSAELPVLCISGGKLLGIRAAQKNQQVSSVYSQMFNSL